MALQLDEIKKRIRDRKKGETLSKAIDHENRIKFHAENFLSPSDISGPVTDFLEWVKKLLPKDKYEIFLSLLMFPTPMVEFTGMLFDELERVFDGKNPNYFYQFTDTYYKDDWEWYRADKLREPAIWRNKGWEKVKTGINSLLVVDMPEVQQGEFPEPYFYFLDIRDVLDYGFHDGRMEYVIFKQKDGWIAVFDELSYRKIKLDKNDELTNEVIEKPHDLGYCPATFFWTSPLNSKRQEIKKSPLSKQLSNLDWLLFFAISKRHLDLYAPYPIYSSYEADCDFRNEETGDYCDGGYLRDKHDHYRMSMASGGSYVLEMCPVCSNKRLTGVGSFIEVPVPTGNNSVDLGKTPVTITTVDRDSLDYNVLEVQRLKKEIFESVVGQGGDMQSKESLNERQVNANYESRTNVLRSLKTNLEIAQKFVDDTCCLLRYGDNFIGSALSMGTEFYIYSVDDLYDQYEKAKKSGASVSELDIIADKLVETEYRNDPMKMQRMVTLKHLEPYRHHSFTEIMELSEKNLLDDELLKIKINFNALIDRFERENMNITEFGSLLGFDEKISIITNKLRDYVKQQQKTA